MARLLPTSLPHLKAVAVRATSYRISKNGTASLPPSPVRPSGVPSRPAARTRRITPGRRPAPVIGPIATHAAIAPDRLALTLPVPPSINHQYATVNGRRVLSAQGRSYKALVAQEVLAALARSAHRRTLLRRLGDADLALAIHFHFASPLRRDVDGGLKIAQDALCEALGLNDNRIVEIHLYKHRDPAYPRIEVTLGLAAAFSHP